MTVRVGFFCGLPFNSLRGTLRVQYASFSFLFVSIFSYSTSPRLIARFTHSSTESDRIRASNSARCRDGADDEDVGVVSD